MSECVVRMEIPESCFVCPFRLGCSTYSAYSFSTSTRRVLPKPLDEGCNILAVLPEGHGRLVDADAMTDDVRSLWDYKTVDGITASTVLKQIMTDIGNCPTIVPAERSET